MIIKLKRIKYILIYMGFLKNNNAPDNFWVEIIWYLALEGWFPIVIAFSWKHDNNLSVNKQHLNIMVIAGGCKKKTKNVFLH